MDRTGRTVIAPRFQSSRDFFRGLAAVQVDQKWGYVNDSGKLVIPAQFDDAHDFLDDLAPVRMGRKWGYVDGTGRTVIEPAFQAAGEFHEGLARVSTWNAVLCSDGRRFTKDDAPIYLYRFEDESFDSPPNCAAQDMRFGFIDKKGELLIPARFEVAQDFSEGVAAVSLDFSRTRKFGYINRSGDWEIEPRFNVAETFSEGLAVVEINGRLVENQIVDQAWGYIDRSGQLKIPAVYKWAGDFSEGLARVKIQSNRLGYIDRTGRVVISPRFSEAWDFADGLAAACDEANCTYIDRSGKSVITAFRAWWSFSDGLAVIDPQGTRGQFYIDTKGRIIAGYDHARN
jgi:hypothetical protein